MQMGRTESGSLEGFCSFADQTEHRVLGTIRGEYMEYECGMAAQASQVNSNGSYCFGAKFKTHEVVPDLLFPVISRYFCTCILFFFFLLRIS